MYIKSQKGWVRLRRRLQGLPCGCLLWRDHPRVRTHAKTCQVYMRERYSAVCPQRTCVRRACGTLHTCCSAAASFPTSEFVATPPPLVRTDASQDVMTLLSACDASFGIFPASVAWLTCTKHLSSRDTHLCHSCAPRGHLSPCHQQAAASRCLLQHTRPVKVFPWLQLHSVRSQSPPVGHVMPCNLTASSSALVKGWMTWG